MARPRRVTSSAARRSAKSASVPAPMYPYAELMRSFIAACIASWCPAAGDPVRLPRGRLVREAQLEQALDDVEERAEAIARGADAVGEHQRGVERGDVDLHHALGDAGGEEVERAARVRGRASAPSSGVRGSAARART